MGNIKARLDRLEATDNARAPIIVFEAGDEVTEEEADRFLREAVGELSAGQLVIRLRRFRFEGHCPPRLISIGGRPVVTASPENQDNLDPLNSR